MTYTYSPNHKISTNSVYPDVIFILWTSNLELFCRLLQSHLCDFCLTQGLSVLQKELFWLLLLYLPCTHQGTFQNICSSTISLDFNAAATLLPWADFFDRNCRWLGLIKWEMEQKEDRGDKNAFPIQGTFRKIVHPLKLLNSHSFSQAFW